MRFIPLSREVRKINRLRREERREQPDVTRWLVLAMTFLLTVFLTSPFYFYKPSAPAAGSRVENPEDLTAWTDFRFVPARALADWRQQRDRTHDRVWAYRSAARTGAEASLTAIFEAAEAMDPATMSAVEMQEAFRRANGRLSLTEAEAGSLAKALQNPRYRQALQNILRDAYDRYLVVDQHLLFLAQHRDGNAVITDLAEPLGNRGDLRAQVLPLEYDSRDWAPVVARRLSQNFGADIPSPEELRLISSAVISAVLQPNLAPDPVETARRRELFHQPDLSTLYEKGRPLLPATVLGRELSADDASLLAAHRAAVEKEHYMRLIGHVIFVALAFVILAFYVRKFSRELSFSSYNVILISLPVLIGLAVEGFCILLAEGRPEQVGYLFPAGAVGMLGVLLLDVRMALLLVTWGCLMFGLQVNLEWDFVIVGLFGGYTGVAAIYSIRKRYEVFVASILIGAVNAAVILIMAFIHHPDELPLADAGLGFTAGIGSFLVLAILPVIERFGIVTDVQLLELTGLHNPLLRQLEELAPGTWQHTLNVAKLAEAAASEIGVNYLLVRAGCYYHDIGKVKKPEYFTENQITREDKMRHDMLSPYMSTRVIMNHVKEGVEMAAREKLPERIIDFIRQHHGTSVVTYFYHKALEAQARGEIKEPVRIEEYRYPGPKPQTIEAAIVMLADSVEATATAKLSNRIVREDDIQQVVRTTIFDKFNDGQFDECNLTLRDLNTIREEFVRVLKSRFHTRIDYPKKATAQKAPAEKKPAAAAKEVTVAVREESVPRNTQTAVPLPKPSEEPPLRAES